MNSYQHVYLSPHFDDISLSCGGVIHQQAQSGQSVLGVTICAAPPVASKFSLYAQAMHQIWGNPTDVVATRRMEDQIAMAVLGIDPYYLAITDCIYRGNLEEGTWYYNSDRDLFGEIQPNDLQLAAQIARILETLVPGNAETTIYAPLGVGHHVDHQLVRAAARDLEAHGCRVVYYEDYPYADPSYPYSQYSAKNEYPLPAILAMPENASLTPKRCFLTEENLQTKLRSIGAYTSQIQILFENEGEMERRVREYALLIGEGNLAERVWTPG